MKKLKEIDLSEIQQDQMYIVAMAEFEDAAPDEIEMSTMLGDELITEMREVYGAREDEDIQLMLIRFESIDADESYRVFEMPKNN